MRLSDFQYELPRDRIAQHPVSQRDKSRLLVLHRDSGELEHRQFCHLVDEFDGNELLILNDTAVIPARLKGHKETGGAVELLLIRNRGHELSWTCMSRSSKPLRQGMQVIFVDESVAEIEEVGTQGFCTITLHLSKPVPSIYSWLEIHGETPLPPYIHRESSEIHERQHDRQRYQTIFAKYPGSVAAPTAGLHFTQAVLAAVAAKGVQIQYITLHVGPGTFLPVRSEDIKTHHMHSEWFAISTGVAEAIRTAKSLSRPIVAVGTTVVRALESATDITGQIQPFQGDTELFITPGYAFKVVDRLITNFHLPGSTLVMLVSALAGRETLLAAYREAIEKKYRFYSYGDAMFIK